MSLAQRIAAGPLSPTETAHLLAPVADALHFAHVQGMVHRDVKPANILLDRTDRPYLGDFGLAVNEEEQRHELSGVRGTRPTWPRSRRRATVTGPTAVPTSTASVWCCTSA